MHQGRSPYGVSFRSTLRQAEKDRATAAERIAELEARVNAEPCEEAAGQDLARCAQGSREAQLDSVHGCRRKVNVDRHGWLDCRVSPLSCSRRHTKPSRKQRRILLSIQALPKSLRRLREFFEAFQSTSTKFCHFSCGRTRAEVAVPLLRPGRWGRAGAPQRGRRGGAGSGGRGRGRGTSRAACRRGGLRVGLRERGPRAA